ncbi:hypothetical protein, partial [Caballeronia mineralivorans]|uniref:hypothetical protein n=1 Tax=Caballeronia mineralivorans TaxID=2010198 RepID=UPI002AFFBB78
KHLGVRFIPRSVKNRDGLLTNVDFPPLALTITPGTAPSLLYEVANKRLPLASPRVMVCDPGSSTTPIAL